MGPGPARSGRARSRASALAGPLRGDAAPAPDLRRCGGGVRSAERVARVPGGGGRRGAARRAHDRGPARAGGRGRRPRDGARLRQHRAPSDAPPRCGRPRCSIVRRAETSLLARDPRRPERVASLSGPRALDPPTLDLLELDRETFARSTAGGPTCFRSSRKLPRARGPGRHAGRPRGGGALGVPGGGGPAQPGRFLRRLLSREEGRIAYFYDAVARLDPAHQRFALGLDRRTRRVARSRSVRGRRVRRRGRVVAGAGRRLQPAGGGPGRGAAPGPRGRRAGRWHRRQPAPSGRPPSATRPRRRVGARGGVASGRCFWPSRSGRAPETAAGRLLKLAFAQRVFGSAAGADLPVALAAVRGVGRGPRWRWASRGWLTGRAPGGGRPVAKQVALLGKRPETPVALASSRGLFLSSSVPGLPARSIFRCRVASRIAACGSSKTGVTVRGWRTGCARRRCPRCANHLRLRASWVG